MSDRLATPHSVVPFPDDPVKRDLWIRSMRPDLERQRASLVTDRPAGWLWETEPVGDGTVHPVLTVFLINRECPWRCLMCDLWRQTTLQPVAPGQVPRQIQWALEAAGPIPSGTRLKLYNAGSFFDAGAIPASDHPAIASLIRGFASVLVECHPSLVRDGRGIRAFQEQIAPARLEVALGLETIHPDVLPKLNKRMTLEDFSAAVGVLKGLGCSTRAFVLVQPPFLSASESVEWAARSAAFAFSVGVHTVALIPTRDGNGAMEHLRRTGQFEPPSLGRFEEAMEAALAAGGGLVLADLWDLERFSDDPARFAARRDRLEQMNRLQRVLPRVESAIPN